MPGPMDLEGLLNTLTESLESANTSLPESSVLQPPSGGISLLDTKNELFLTYLQNLVFLVLVKLQNLKSSDRDTTHAVSDDRIIEKLVGLRIYLEKGIRPIEGKLQYQLDKLLQTANEADAAATPAQLPSKQQKISKNTSGVRKEDDSDHSGHSGDDSDDSADSAASGLLLPTIQQQPGVSELTHRPNLSAFSRSSKQSHGTATTSGVKSAIKDPSAPYRPPRINPTSLPTTTTTTTNSTKPSQRPPRKSYMIDDYVREEIDDAPLSQPSIGAGSRLRGKERRVDEERTGYEEQQLVRLPSGGRKEKREKRRRELLGDDGAEDLRAGFGERGGGGGGIDGVDFRGKDGRLGGKKRVKINGGGGSSGRESGMGGSAIGEKWENRMKRGLIRKRR